MNVRFLNRYVLVIAALVLGLTCIPVLHAVTAPAKRKAVIKDYRKHLNRKFKKVKRKSTRFVIIHTSEAGLTSTLRTLSKGKSINGYRYRTRGGHAHYAIARNGLVYRILHHRYRADHAGLSMWNGIEDISSHSLGIELVGYHYDKITDAQYNSLYLLVKTLRKMYRIRGKNVLTHSQVSYGKPNDWHRRPHRGRKRCALNFDRSRIGLGNDLWTYDPDVKARRLTADRRVYLAFYKRPRYKKTTSTPKPAQVPVSVPASVSTPKPAAAAVPSESLRTVVETSNIISKDNTAWNIAGGDYNSPATLYVLPGGLEIRGDKIQRAVGWDRIPRGTQVLLNQPKDRETKKGPVFEITTDFTAWSYAGKAYRNPSTFYFFTSGGFVEGNRVSDWDSVPKGTRMIIGYEPPKQVLARVGQTPWGIAGRAYNSKNTVYYIRGGEGGELLTGDKIKDFSDLPRGTEIFLKQGK
jgi:hypothetical protein